MIMKKIIIIILLLKYASLAYCISSSDMEGMVEDFCKTEDKYEFISDYHSSVRLSKSESIDFVFMALDRLLDNPQKPDLKYAWKISKLSNFIDKLDPDTIPLRHVATLFKALRIGGIMLTGDIIFIDLLDKIVGNNPGYTMKYLESGNFTNETRIELINQWEKIFEENKENILKKRYYKSKYFGKSVAD